MSSILENHKKVWNSKKIIREIYTSYYKMILKDINDEAKVVELGGGTGNFKEFEPRVISSDIVEEDWLDMCFDAHQMPFKDSELSSIVMIDVLHHLSNPILFFKESARVLKNGGRILILEPYPSLFSSIVYKLFHPEPFIFDVDYFKKGDSIETKDPWDSNQAISYILFFKNRKKFLDYFKNIGIDFKFVKIKRLSCILYPLSGGFENRQLIPDFLIPFFKVIEVLFTPLRALFAFRDYVVIEIDK